jgi:hypothetical protein
MRVRNIPRLIVPHAHLATSRDRCEPAPIEERFDIRARVYYPLFGQRHMAISTFPFFCVPLVCCVQAPMRVLTEK